MQLADAAGLHLAVEAGRRTQGDGGMVCRKEKRGVLELEHTRSMEGLLPAIEKEEQRGWGGLKVGAVQIKEMLTMG